MFPIRTTPKETHPGSDRFHPCIRITHASFCSTKAHTQLALVLTSPLPVPPVRHSYRPEPAGSVVGKPKGQGQTQETVQDRRKKEASKGRGANHNRRNMADRKRNKGMIPS